MGTAPRTLEEAGPPRGGRSPARGAFLAASTAAAAVLLLWNVAAGISANVPTVKGMPGRYLADVSIATHFLLRDEFPVATYRVRRVSSRPRRDESFLQFEAALASATESSRIRPHQPFRTVPAEPLAENRVYALRTDDSGRALLLGYAFKGLGGVAPFFGLWAGPFLAVGLFVWIAIEAALARRAWAGQVMLFTIASSAFATDLLALAYSAVGFYLAATLTLVAYAIYACRASGCSGRGLLVRTAMAAGVLAVADLCRSGAVALAPAFLVAAAYGACRSEGPGSRGRAGLWITTRDGVQRTLSLPQWPLVVLLVLPVLVVPIWLLKAHSARLVAATAEVYDAPVEAQQQAMWLGLWEGLGDFDRKYGHVWLDEVASKVAQGRQLASPGSEKIFKRLVLTNVKNDPMWYSGILVKRVLATASQWKLRPWEPLSGHSVAPSTSPNEGATDVYYTLTATVDRIRLGRLEVELPLPLIWLPVLAVIAAAAAARTPRMVADAAVVGIVALGTLTFPVVVTTASALETQTFGMVYVAAFGFAVDHGARRLSPWWNRRRAALSRSG